MTENEKLLVDLNPLLPPMMASKAEDIGVKKGNMDIISMFMLALLAGAFISMGAIFCTTVVTGIADKVGFGLTKAIGGLVFCLGLILVIVAGAELFTGNSLLVMAAASKKLPISKLLTNWVVVYIGNFMGSILTAYFILLTLQYTAANGAVGATALKIANATCGLDSVPALARGVYCNALVCAAVWLSFSCHSTTDKILAILFPISAFVACGFEHCVANMYFIPIGLFIKSSAAPEFWAGIGKTAADYSSLTWANMIVRNLIPVTIGNVIGGGVFVGGLYWIIYLRKRSS